MISFISLDGFKCFDSAEFALGRINVFTGLNGRGKSSLFQALLMLSQSIVKNNSLQYFEVNGCYIHQDSFDDILCKSPIKNRFSIRIEGNDSSSSMHHSLVLSYKRKTRTKGEVCGFEYNGKSYFESASELSALTEGKKQRAKSSLFNYPPECHALLSDFAYLSANRLGTSLFEEKSDPSIINPLGSEGQYRLNMLQGNKELQSFINNQLAYIMDGGEIALWGENDDSPVLNLGFKHIGDVDGDFVLKSINCGFGYSYILSILILLHTSSTGCLFIENPEAHLHPSAQSRLMQVLCSICASKSIQLFVETHSEHIVNALRLLVVNPDIPINNEDIVIHFFNRDFRVEKLVISDKGQINSWPIGFFDQQENDLAEILRLGLFKK